MLWEVDIHPAEGQPDLTAHQVAAAAAELGTARELAEELRRQPPRGECTVVIGT